MGSRPNQAQLEVLAGFLEQNPEIAKGLLRTQQGKVETKRKWSELALTINALGGVQKDGSGWSKYWAEKKCALKKVCAQHAQSMRRTGGGTESVPSLSELEQRLIAVMGGHSFATGNSEVTVDPFPQRSQSHPSPAQIELHLPSTSQVNVEVEDVEGMDVHSDSLHHTVPPLEKEEKKPEDDLSNHEVIFLRSIVESPDFNRRCESIESEEDLVVKPVSLGNVNIIKSLSEYRGTNIRTIEQAELAILLSRVHFKALIEAHDQIGAIWLDRGSGIDDQAGNKAIKEEIKDSAEGIEGSPEENGDMPIETVKVVGLRKVPGQPLGLTVTTDEHGQLIVARIMAGSAAAKQALLSVGDVLLEVDGVQINSEDQLKEAVAKPNDRVSLKVGPNLKEKSGQLMNKLTCYMRALFDYDPKEDTLLPCKEIGLEFKRGDILQVSDRKDPNWWQASHVENPDVVGLIPSPELEERRKAYVPPEADFVHKISICGARISKKKKKFVYESRSSVQLEGAELALYEEVARTPPFLRRTLALVGTRGVGRRTLKNRMVQEYPDRFGFVVPHTSRPPRPMEENGQSYWFVSREEMERDVHAGRFLEHGEHNGHLYGTHLDSIRAVIKEGKMCILDCAPQSLKLLHNSSEFLPFVVMIGAPGIEQLRNLTYASNRNLTFDRQSSIRYSSRRARTLESLASLYEEEDMKQTLEDSARIQRQYEKYIDLVITNNNTDTTYSKIMDALHSLSTDHQWVPVSWIY